MYHDPLASQETILHLLTRDLDRSVESRVVPL